MSKAAPICIHWWSEEIGELVEEARRAFRRCRRNPTELAWQEYLEANRAKRAAISKAKR
jgi:preprotein translocase subunit Sss1